MQTSVLITVVVNSYALINLAILFIFGCKKKEKELKREIMFRNAVLATMICVFFSTVTWVVDGGPTSLDRILNKWCCFILFMACEIQPFFMAAYIDTVISVGSEASKKRIKYLLIPFIIHSVLVVINLFVPVLYYFDENNVFHYQFYGIGTFGIVGIYIIIAMLFIIFGRKRLKAKTLVVLLVMCVFPIAFGILQIMNPDFSSAYCGYALCMFVMYFTIQKDYQESNARVINSLADIYTTTLEIDLRKGEYRLFKSDDLKGERPFSGNAQKLFDEFCDTLRETSYGDFRAFTDFSSLDMRMKDKNMISMEGLDKQGKWRRYSIIADEREESGRLRNVVFVTREIEEERRKELEHRQMLEEKTEEAERANEAKRDFLSRMSHDIRTPINGIMGMTRVAMENEENFDKVKGSLAVIDQCSKTLLSLVNDVLDISRIENGKLEIVREPFDLSQMFDSAVSSIQGTAMTKNITVNKDTSQLKDRYFVGDEVRIKQVAMNIMGNAAKFTEKNGQIDLSVKTERRPGGRTCDVTFVIKDNGIGMNEDFVQKLFKPFIEGNKSARSTYSGTGLGIAISKQILDLMKGEIQIESEEGVGTTVTIELPLMIDCDHENDADNEVESAEVRIDKLGEELKGSRVLVVEDNPVNMMVAQTLLEEHGMTVDCAVDGVEAVQQFVAQPNNTYDFIIMDIMMPRMDGYEATRTIRSLDRADAKLVPIIALSANAYREDEKGAIDSGMDAHVAKPLDLAILFKVMKDTKKRK